MSHAAAADDVGTELEKKRRLELKGPNIDADVACHEIMCINMVD